MTTPTARTIEPSASYAAMVSDAADVTGTRLTRDGYLVAECRVARTGIQEYYGAELGLSDPQKLYRFYRPADEVFARASMASYAHRPVTNDHPVDDVTAENWKQHAIGNIGEDVVADGDYVRVPLILMDQAAIADVQAGKRELSMGYNCTLDWTPGKAPDGTFYDAVMRGIRSNHCAVVDKGRAGHACRIGDRVRNTPPNNQEPTNMKTVTIDGRSFSVADDAADAILAAQTKFDAVNAALQDAARVMPAASDTIKALKDQIAAKEIELADARKAADEAAKAIPTAADLARMADERAALIDTAKTIKAEIVADGKDADAIRREAVASKMGDKAVDGKPADYVAAMFDALASVAKSDGNDPVRDSLKGGPAKPKDARAEHLANLSNAWRS